MKIVEIKVLNGPNYWSTYRKQLIDMKLDLEDSEDFPTNTIDGFAERLEALMPSLYEHRCSENRMGGFFERVRTGTWLGHVVEHIALELQSLAGMQCGFGRTRSADVKGVYHVVFAYKVRRAGIYAAKAAVRIVQALESDLEYDIATDIKELIRINKTDGFGPSTQSLINEAEKRKIPYKRIDNNSLVMLGQGKHQKLICATITSNTNTIGVDIASNKDQTRQILKQGFIPIPDGKVVSNKQELKIAVEELGFPLVVKPIDGNHGNAVKVNINTLEEAQNAYAIARQVSNNVIVERFITGHDYRFLVVDYKLQAVARRTPAMVIGNNESTVKELIEETNKDPRRGEEHEKILTKIKVDDITHSILIEKNLTLNSVLPFGEILFLKDAANLSSGGTATDVTDIVHSNNIFLVERVARLMNLDVCGIDIIAEDITSPIAEGNGAVIEVNASPGFRMHLAPTKGHARNVAESVMKMLYPPGAPCRIPIVAITGTNGKTTTTRLIAHLAKNAGHNVGYTNTDGIFIQDQQIYAGDCSGPSSAEAVLRDPLVDFAVLECARGGILRSGLGFDKCDISIITNITEDHLGLDGINTLEDLARVKAVVANSTSDDGYAILNADDDLVYNIRRDLDCNIALFSVKENNERVKAHIERGGLAAFVEKGFFTVCSGEWKMRIAKVKEIPLTMDGNAICMIKNILPALLVASIRDFDIKIIRKTLSEFIPGPEFTPGRMNVFHFRSFDVMIDYAHNPDGFVQLAEFMKTVNASERIGIITTPGDRRDEDLHKMGMLAAQMFDKIIIRHDDDCRGRTKENITEVLTKGIKEINSAIEVNIISDEIEALTVAMQQATKGSFIVNCVEKVKRVLDFVTKAQDTEKHYGSFIHTQTI